MKIGLISDSHGNVGRLTTAVAVLKARGAQMLVHCGDIGGTDAMAALGASGLPTYAVAGNTDRDLELLSSEAVTCGVRFAADMLVIPLENGGSLVCLHGNDVPLLTKLLVEGKHTYICHGHTHLARDTRVGKTRLINPGALHNARPLTVAILDTETDEVEHIELE
jgi:putative phosphoesterase